jgi:hypothetical protein
MAMLSNRKPGSLTRRQFVVAGALGSAALAIGCKAGKRGDWESLTEEEARTLTAVCDQIVPEDEFPSASQAGVLNYIDRQLMRPLSPASPRIPARSARCRDGKPEAIRFRTGIAFPTAAIRNRQRSGAPESRLF